MEFVKKKYKRAEIEDIFSAIDSDFKGKLSDAKEEIESLKKEIANLNTKLSEYEGREKEIAETLRLAKEKAEEVVNEAQLKYAAEMKSLRNFADKWRSYFKYLRDKYPLYPAVKDAEKVYSEIEKAIEFNDSVLAVKTLEGVFEDKNGEFNPKEKIYEYIKNNTEDGEFDMDKVLNPGDIRLEDICKELGLTEEN